MCLAFEAWTRSTTPERSSPMCWRCSRRRDWPRSWRCGAEAAEGDRRLALRTRCARRAPARRSCSKGMTSISAVFSGADLLAARRRAVHHAPSAVITHDRDGRRNVGEARYRMQVLGPRETAMHWQLHKRRNRVDFSAADGRMEVAVALGLDPVTALCGERAAPEAHRRAGCSRASCAASRVDVVKAVTIELEVPAAAEIVLEGYVEETRRPRRRGPVRRRPHGLLHAGRAVPGSSTSPR